MDVGSQGLVVDASVYDCRRADFAGTGEGVLGFVVQAEDGIRGLVRSRGLGDVYKRQGSDCVPKDHESIVVGDLNIAPLEHDVWSHKDLLKIVSHTPIETEGLLRLQKKGKWTDVCLLYTSDAADDLLCVDLGARRIIKKKIKCQQPR